MRSRFDPFQTSLQFSLEIWNYILIVRSQHVTSHKVLAQVKPHDCLLTQRLHSIGSFLNFGCPKKSVFLIPSCRILLEIIKGISELHINFFMQVPTLAFTLYIFHSWCAGNATTSESGKPCRRCKCLIIFYAFPLAIAFGNKVTFSLIHGTNGLSLDFILVPIERQVY